MGWRELGIIALGTVVLTVLLVLHDGKDNADHQASASSVATPKLEAVSTDSSTATQPVVASAISGEAGVSTTSTVNRDGTTTTVSDATPSVNNTVAPTSLASPTDAAPVPTTTPSAAKPTTPSPTTQANKPTGMVVIAPTTSTTAKPTTTTTAAPKPVVTQVNDNDSRIVYSGTWAAADDGGGQYTKYNGDDHWTQTTGSSYSFTFSGTAIQVWGMHQMSNGYANIVVDNRAPVTVDFYGATRVDNVSVYALSGLTAGSHTIKVTCVGSHNTSATANTITLDRFTVTS